MTEEFANLSVPDIEALIERAEFEIARRQEVGKEALKAEIAERLRNSGLAIEDLFPEAGKKGRGRAAASGEKKAVLVKYRDPVSGETWSGRGPRPPRWVATIMSQRRWSLDQFKQSGEYDA